MIQIAPSMLSADFLHLEKDVEMVNGCADIFHLDIMDGVLVPNISYGFPVIEAIAKKAVKPMDAHLMIVHPEKYFERFAKTGVKMMSFHLEAADRDGNDPAEMLDMIKSYGIKAGMAINPDIAPERVFPYLDKADYILVMSVFAGFGGQKFIETTYDRIRAIKSEITRIGSSCQIEVDGGVSPSNASALAAAGAEILVAGSAVFKAEDQASTVEAMRAIK